MAAGTGQRRLIIGSSTTPDVDGWLHSMSRVAGRLTLMDPRSQLRHDIEKSGYYPDLVDDSLKTALGDLGDQTGTRKGSQRESTNMQTNGMRKDLRKDLAQGWRKDGARMTQGCARTSQGLKKNNILFDKTL